MKKLIIFLALLTPYICFSAPSNTISITNPTDNTIVSASDESTRYNEITSKYNAHSHSDVTATTNNTFTIGDGAVGNKDYAVDTDNAGNPTLRFSTTTGSWQVSTLAGAFPGRIVVSGIVDLDEDTAVWTSKTADEDKVRIDTAGTERVLIDSNGLQLKSGNFITGTGIGITDLDGDTKIQLDESADEDIIRFDIEGTETVVFGDGSNEDMVRIANGGTLSGLEVDQSGVLESGNAGIYVVSSTDQTTMPLVYFNQANNASEFACLDLAHTGNGPHINMAGDTANSTPTEGDLWYEASPNHLYLYADQEYTIDKTAVSDRKAKKNIKKSTLSGSLVDDLEVVEFEYKAEYSDDSITKHYGFIANDVDEVYPYAVMKFDEDHDYVDYKRLIPLLVIKIQELEARVAALEAQ